MEEALPRIEKNLPAETYHKWDGASYSRLKLLSKSPAHLRYALDNPDSPSEAMKLGRALHCAALEPELFQQKFKVFSGDRRTKVGKEDWEYLINEVGEQNILRDADYARIDGMATSIWRHPAVKAMGGFPKDIELSLQWKAGDTLCKGRIDAFIPKLQTILDIKTTQDASLTAMQYTTLKYKYHWQAYHYMQGCRACHLDVDSYLFICVESNPPYSVAVYGLMQDFLDYAKPKIESLIKLYNQCITTNTWPGYSDEIVDISMPNTDGDYDRE